MHGSLVYLDKFGKRVEVTSVSTDPLASQSGWKDLINVGEVVHYMKGGLLQLRSGGTLNMFSKEEFKEPPIKNANEDIFNKILFDENLYNNINPKYITHV